MAEDMTKEQEVKRWNSGWVALVMGMCCLPLAWLSGERIFTKGNTEFGNVAVFMTALLAFLVLLAIAVYMIREDSKATKAVVKSI